MYLTWGKLHGTIFHIKFFTQNDYYLLAKLSHRAILSSSSLACPDVMGSSNQCIGLPAPESSALPTYEGYRVIPPIFHKTRRFHSISYMWDSPQMSIKLAPTHSKTLENDDPPLKLDRFLTFQWSLYSRFQIVGSAISSYSIIGIENYFVNYLLLVDFVI